MITSQQDLIAKLYGIRTTPTINPETATVGTTVVKVLNTNPRRFSFTIINLSNNIVYVGPVNTVSSTAGILLAPNGGQLSLNYAEDLELAANEWFAVASAAGSTVYVIENSMYKGEE